MIRQADDRDTKEIIALWHECFPEDKAFAHYFFRNIYNPLNSIVYTHNDKIVSTLQRIPFYIENVGKVSYIYGACTSQEYRSHGIMAKLLEYSQELDINQKLSACILIPASDRLFDYYNKFRFDRTFKINRKLYIKTDEKSDLQIKTVDDSYSKKFKPLYSDALKGTDYIYRKPEFFAEQINLFRSQGGESFILYNNKSLYGYALVWKSENEIIAQEIICTNNSDYEIFCNKIMNYYGIDKLDTVSLTGNCNDRLGSIKFYKNISDNIDNLKINLLYN